MPTPMLPETSDFSPHATHPAAFFKLLDSGYCYKNMWESDGNAQEHGRQKAPTGYRWRHNTAWITTVATILDI